MLLLYFLVFSIASARNFVKDFAHNDDFIEESINGQMTLLAEQIWNKSFSDRTCLVLWSEWGLIDNFMPKLQPSIIKITTTSGESCDRTAFNPLVEAFRSNCNIYIVQISKPSCFFQLWDDAREMTVHRHNPLMLFLPVYPESTAYGEDLLEEPFAEISADILVAELETSGAWPVKLSTNNFAVRVGTGNRTGRILLDEWHPDLGFKNNTNLYPKKISDLKGKEVRVAAFTYLPYVNIEPFDGTESRIIHEYCRKYNCSIKVSDDGYMWGSITGYRQGNGVVGTVYKGEADFGAASIYPWIEYHHYLDYSSCYMYAGAALLVPKPVLLGGWRTPFLPFGLEMWLIFTLCLVVSSLGLYVVTSATIKFSRFGDAIKKTKQFTTLPDSMIRSLGMSVLQQPAKLLYNTPVRQLFTSFEFLYLILTSCYSAQLASHLTVPQFTKPIDTYKELAHSGLYWLADHDVWKYALVHSDQAEDIAVVDHFRATSYSDLMKLSPTGKYGIAIERLAAGYYSEQPHITEEVIANLHVMDQLLYASAITTTLEKGSPYTESLNMHINRILDAGLFIFWEGEMARKFLNYRVQMALKFARKKKMESDVPKILTTDHIQGAFIIYGIGIAISLCFLLSEIIYKRKIKAEKVVSKSVHRYVNFNKLENLYISMK